MARQIQIRRGTAAENDNFTGAIGEVTMDITNKTLRVHDGETLGGTVLAKQSEIPDLTNLDYVVESQFPTAENNYTWYRKYKSGWVEQGGITTIQTIDAGWSAEQILVFPITMADSEYTITFGLTSGNFGSVKISRTKTGGTIAMYNRSAAGRDQYQTTWFVTGFAE